MSSCLAKRHCPSSALHFRRGDVEMLRPLDSPDKVSELACDARLCRTVPIDHITRHSAQLSHRTPLATIDRHDHQL